MTIEPIAPVGHRMAGLVHDLDDIARHRHGRRAELDRQDPQAHRIGGDRPAGLGLPPVVDDRPVENLLRPGDGVGIGPFAGQKERVHRGDVVVLEKLRLRVFLAHGAQRRRRGEEGGDLVVLDHPPEGAGVGRADRLALVEHAGAAVNERRIDDVGMPDDPADVGGGPVGIAGLDVVDRRHRPFEGDEVAADVAHHPLGDPGRARRVEDIERIGRGQIGAGRPLAGGLCRVDQCRPVLVARRVHPRRDLWALKDDRGRRLVLRQADGEIEQRLIFDDAAGLDAAAGGQDHFRLGVVDAGRELLGGKAAEHHRMDRPDARAGEHADDRLRDHRHIDQHPVAGDDAEIGKNRAERRGLVQELAIADRAFRPRHRAVVVERRLIAAAGFDVAVERVVAGVAAGVGEPVAVDARSRIEYPFRRPRPGDLARGFGPKGLWIGAPLVIGLPVAAHWFRSRRRPP